MFLADAPLTFKEYAMRDPLPLATIFHEVFEFLQRRKDVVLFGAHAVNMYADPPRMTSDVDVLTTNAPRVAEELKERLGKKFHIAIRVREATGEGLRVYQIQKPKNRHLIDVRETLRLPPSRVFRGVQTVAPVELAAMKAEALYARKDKGKGATDRVDLHRLLNTLPFLRDSGEVDRILAARAPHVLPLWRKEKGMFLEEDEEGSAW